MRFGLFRRRDRPEPGSEAAGRVKAWLVATLDLAPETALTVSEIVCLDPSCPGTETVMLVMERGRKTRAYKVAKAMDEVTEQDVRQALSSP
jgi:hypothetical protein